MIFLLQIVRFYAFHNKEMEFASQKCQQYATFRLYAVLPYISARGFFTARGNNFTSYRCIKRIADGKLKIYRYHESRQRKLPLFS